MAKGVVRAGVADSHAGGAGAAAVRGAAAVGSGPGRLVACGTGSGGAGRVGRRHGVCGGGGGTAIAAGAAAGGAAARAVLAGEGYHLWRVQAGTNAGTVLLMLTNSMGLQLHFERTTHRVKRFCNQDRV